MRWICALVLLSIWAVDVTAGPIGAPPSGGGHIITYSGEEVPQRPVLNFEGAECIDDPGLTRTTCAFDAGIPGHVIHDDGSLVLVEDILNFTTGISCVNDGANSRINCSADLLDDTALVNPMGPVFWNTDAAPQRVETADCTWLEDPDAAGEFIGLDCPAPLNSSQALVLREASSNGTHAFVLEPPDSISATVTHTLTSDLKLPATAVTPVEQVECVTYTDAASGISALLDELGYISAASGKVWWAPSGGATLTWLRCDADAAGTVNLRNEDGSPADIFSADADCSTEAKQTGINGSENVLPADRAVSLQGSSGWTPGSFVTVCFGYTLTQ